MVVRELSESLKLTEETINSRAMISDIKYKSRTNRPWQLLLEDIVNINHINCAEIFQYLLDKLKKNRSYFFCGFDLFYLNNFNTSLIDQKSRVKIDDTNSEKKRAKIGKAIQWLAKPHSVKPETANLYNFIAFLLKNNSIAKTRQVVVIQGEKASGKSTQLNCVLDFFRFLGKTEFLSNKNEAREQVWRMETVGNIRKSSEQYTVKNEDTQTRRSRAISQNKKPKILSKLREETMRVNVMNLKASMTEERRFASEEMVSLLTRGLRILELFTSSIDSSGRRSSNACMLMKLKVGEQEDGCLLRRGCFQVNFFLTQLLQNKWLGGFESFYAFLEEEDETFLNAYGLKKQVQCHSGLFNDANLKNLFPHYKQQWAELKQILPSKLLRQVQKSMCATLILININKDDISKEISFLAILLEVDKQNLEEFFKIPAEQSEMIPRDKMRFYRNKGRNAATVLYRAIMDMLVSFLNIQMFEVFRVSASAKELETQDAFDLEFVDFFGYIDNSHQDQVNFSKAKAKKENFSYEFLSNWLNEKMFAFYCRKKFKKTRKNDRDIRHITNDEILKKIDDLLSTLRKHSDYNEAVEVLGENHLVFLKKAMNFLGQSGIRSTNLSSEGHYLDFSHFFSESMNYDLRSIHELTEPQTLDFDAFWEGVLSKSKGLVLTSNWKLLEILISQYVKLKLEYGQGSEDWRKLCQKSIVDNMIQTDSDVDDINEEWKHFSQNLEDAEDIFFINCLRIAKVANPKDIEAELYKTFDGVDLESLIDFYKSNYPVRFAYDYVYKKFGLETTVLNLLGARVDFENIDELKHITKQMLHLVLPERGNYIIDENYLYVKYDFFDELENKLKKLSQNKTIKRIIEEMLILALESQIKKRFGKSFDLAKRFIQRYTKPRVMDQVQEARVKFLKPLQAFRAQKEEQYVSARYASFASQMLTNVAHELELEKIVFIQSWARGRIARAKFKAMMHEKRELEKNIQQLIELRDKGDALAVLRAVAKQEFLFEFLRIRRGLLLKIQRFFRAKYFKLHINKRIIRKKKNLLIQKMNKAEDLVVRNLVHNLESKSHLKHPGTMRPNEQINCPVIFPGLRTQVMRKRQLEIHAALLGFHLTKPQEMPMNFQENLSSVLNLISREGDVVMKITLLDEVTIIQTIQKKVHVFDNINTQRHIIVSLPFKSHFVSYFNQFLYIIDEGFRLRLKYIPFKDPHPDESFRPSRTTLIEDDHEREAMFVFAKFRSFVLKNRLFIGVTECDKLCIKNDLSDEFTETKIVQFKRKINMIDCGRKFYILLDSNGVLYGGGDNSKGQLGQGHREAVDQVVSIKALSYQKAIIKSMSCGGDHVLAVTSNNHVFSWGSNKYGQINPSFKSESKVSIDIVDRPIRILQNVNFIFSGQHKLQVKAGRYSSYVLSSAGQLIFFGTSASHKKMSPIKRHDLQAIFGKDLWPVSLDVQWNSGQELVYIRYIDGLAKGVVGKPKLKKVHRDLFLNFMGSPSELIGFSDRFANRMDPAFLSNKMAQTSNKKHHELLQKEKERTWNYMMLSSKIQG